MPYVIPLRDGDPSAADQIGNKAASLVELSRAGFNVPNGFCITTEAFREWQQTGSIGDQVLHAIMTSFQTLTVPVAVRSSSPSEDRADASFAGQYQTVLGVRTRDELLAAIETCWRSAGSTAANAYRKDQGDTAAVEMAVLVQELVKASAAGVVFTIHPVSDRLDQVVVNANYGLGESVVSGRAEPDTFILDKHSGSIVETRLGSKKITSQLTGTGVEEVLNSPDLQSRPSLSGDQLRQLAEAAVRLEARYDAPMDAEWAFEGDVLHMLQARPVTTGVEAYYTDLLDQWARDRSLTIDPEAVWARGSPLSGLPVSPLYYSEMAAFFSDMFPRIAELQGVVPARRKSFRYYRGFTYSDVTFSSDADPSGVIKAVGPFSAPWRNNLRLALRFPKTLAFWCNISAYDRKWKEEWFPGIEARRPDMATASANVLREFIEYIEVQRRERSIFAALGVKYANDYLGLLTYLVRIWARGMGEETTGVLTSGVPDSLTHDENLDIWQLAVAAEKLSAVRKTLVSGRFDEIPNVEGGKGFLDLVEAFRKERPHRGCSDRDLYQPRWGDNINLLLGQLGSMLSLRIRIDPAGAHDRTADTRRRTEEKVLQKIERFPFGPLRRAVFLHVLRAAQRYWIHRDNQRHSFDRYFFELRNAYSALGSRLADQGALGSDDHVFFAAKTELYAFLDGKLSSDRLRKRTQWRRDWWFRVKELDPPPLLKGNLPFERSGEQPSLSDGDLAGVGGAPGIVTGPVRIVKTLKELGSVEQGDILVTHAIDPAWTPVFGTIGGVISEEGGILSHATVLGREYGLPVVIGVAGAASALASGDIVEVNGTRGTVRRVRPDSSPAESAAANTTREAQRA